jgi:hydroxymethylglutaryl-CoA lyase
MSLKYPSKVVVGDISVRDGLQHEERFIPTRAKLWLAEQLILAGFKRIEVTNFGNPKGMPQFADADELMESIYTSKLVADRIEDVETTAITIRERAVERAIASRQKGFGPDRILFMVSTSESHHRVNSGLSLKDYWKMAEKYIQLAHDNGLKVCGTVSTIWGCPIEGPTDTKKALEFTRRWLDIGADDIEHADHDGSAPPNEVHDYYSMVLDAFPDPNLHVAHFHTTRGWPCRQVLPISKVHWEVQAVSPPISLMVYQLQVQAFITIRTHPLRAWSLRKTWW